MRNKEIVNLSDYILAIPYQESRGMRFTISYVKQIRKPVFVFEYEKKVR